MLVVAAASLPPWAARAAETAVDLELVLAVDTSVSIDDYEFRLQRAGYGRAFTDRGVIRAITSGTLRRIAVAYVEWSAGDDQATLIDWTIIEDGASAVRFAAALAALKRKFRDGTSISGAIDYSLRLFEGNGIAGTRRVIDISGDGPNNWGRPSWQARDDAVAAGIVINGLAILNDRPSRPPWPEEPVDQHYRAQVIGGPGAFMITVDGFEAFAEGIRRKLIREIADRDPGRVPVARHVSLTHDRSYRQSSNDADAVGKAARWEQGDDP